MATKANSKPCQTSEMEPQDVTGYRGEFRILPNIYDGASVFLQTMINLTNVMKVFVFYDIAIAKNGRFYRYFHIT